MAVININRNQFEEMVHSGKTVLVEFSAHEWRSAQCSQTKAEYTAHC